MTRRILHFAGLLSLAAPAFAAKPADGLSSDDLSIQAMHNYAACVADQTPKGAVELLALDYRSAEYMKKLNRLAHGNGYRCSPGMSYRFNGVLFAGGLAERLMTDRQDGARFARLIAYDAGRPPISANNLLDMVSICVVRAAPANVWGLFRSEPTSREELAALRAIGPTLMNCVPSGQTMKINRQGVRAMLALASYRLAQPRFPVADQ